MIRNVTEPAPSPACPEPPAASLDRNETPLAVPGAAFARANVPSLPPGLPVDLSTLERLAIEEALRRAGGNRTHAARLLGIGLRTLRNRLRAWREDGAPSHSAAMPGRPGSHHSTASAKARSSQTVLGHEDL